VLKDALTGDREAIERLAYFLEGWGDRHLSRRKVARMEDREDLIVWFAARVMRNGLAHLRDVGPDDWERYLFRVLASLTIDWWRRSRGHGMVETLEIDMAGPESGDELIRLQDRLADERDPAELALRRINSEVLLAAMEQLKEEDRRLLRLRFWRELTVAEIGELLGLARGTAAKRLHDVLHRIKEVLVRLEQA
jgi:RNA polymerase sigma factor (sigma-70 family)